MSESKSFFTTLPGILSGLAALITAVGGLLFSRSLLRWAHERGYLPGYTESDYWDEALGYCVALGGLAFQWQCGFSLPFPLNVVFFPLTLVEMYIRWTITSSTPLA